MFRLLLSLGCIIPALYKLMQYGKNRKAVACEDAVAVPLIQFCPKLTIYTNIAVPVRSHNGGEEKKPKHEMTSAIDEAVRSKASKPPAEYLKTRITMHPQTFS